jgi:alpha-tubulin suppressor-like RCC1 family protein
MSRFRPLQIVIVLALLVTNVSASPSVSGPYYLSVTSGGSAQSFMPLSETCTRDSTAQSTPLALSVTAIAAGSGHTCALTSGGGVTCWGYNVNGQLGDDTMTLRLTPVNVSGLTSGIMAIAAGGYDTCALTSAGGVKCWGRNCNGQLGDGTTTTRLTPVDVSGLTSDAMAVTVGLAHACALTGTGGVKCWGFNYYGELGDGTTTQRLVPVDVSGLTSGVVAIAGGYFHTCALTNAGSVKCWGYNYFGELGDGTTTDRLTPVNVSGLTSGVMAIAARGDHTCALTSAGGVKCWGYNGSGRLGDGTTTNRLTPINVNGLTSGVTAIAAGEEHTCALTNAGGVKCWGENHSGQLGDGTTTDHLTPVNVSGLTGGVTAIAAGDSHICVLMSAGGVKCWGANSFGQLGNSTAGIQLASVDVSGLASGVTAISTGGNYTCAGGAHTCALTSAGGVKCWGSNGAGQLGDGTTTQRLTPVNVSGLTSGVMAVTVGVNHTCALTSVGGVKCWGYNAFGKLGDGTTINRHTPVDVSALTSGVRVIAAGYYHTCALTSAGGVKCWGYNNAGQLGDGTTTDHLTPVNVSGLTGGVRAIAAGYYHTCALTSAGGVKCWGGNFHGQLGDGTTTDHLTPVNVSGLTGGVTAIAAGVDQTCALTSVGGVKCWGRNANGQLGDGTTTTDHLTPVDVSGLTGGVTAIAAGGAHTCAVTSAGGVKCWGDNDEGQLGTGILTYRTTPVDVLLDTDGDGLLDDWEINGYDANGDGIVDVNLPAMGANPLRKDIFVEVDYMVDYGTCSAGQCTPGHSHRPSPVAIARVVGAFANAPVSNPDGSAGITLHVDVSEAIPHQDTVQSTNEIWNWSGFDRIKNQQRHFDPRRARIFHYAIFAHDLGGGIPLRTSGVSRDIGASDFVVSLGGSTSGIGTTPEQAGTFMHELGHNLGLRHGGNDDQNYEPNYLSVMNYSFQMSGLLSNTNDGLLDYSRFGNIPTLDEAHLNETVGLNGGATIAGYGTHYYCRPLGIWRDNWVTNANGPINWDCIGGAGGTDVHTNINNGRSDEPDSTLSILTSFEDWLALVYNGGPIGPDSSAISLDSALLNDDQSMLMDELTFEIDSQLYRPYKVALLGADDIVASLGISFTKVISAANLGALTATIAISSTPGNGWFDLSAIPLSATLSPSASLFIPITITVPTSRAGMITDNITLNASIQGSPLMGDSAILNVRIGPLAQFEAEPVNGIPPHTVTFTDYSVGQITDWLWDFGDGVTSTLQSPSHIYTRAGIYTPTLTVTGIDGTDTVAKAALITVLHKVYLPLILRNH